MFDANKELMKFYKDGMSQILNGIILRNKTISKAGPSSAVIFVPKYLLGQKVKVIIIPENTEVAGLRSTLDKRQKKISRLNKELKKLGSEAGEIEGELEEVESTETPEKEESLEDDGY